jgi:hypothetical protein
MRSSTDPEPPLGLGTAAGGFPTGGFKAINETVDRVVHGIARAGDHASEQASENSTVVGRLQGGMEGVLNDSPHQSMDSPVMSVEQIAVAPSMVRASPSDAQVQDTIQVQASVVSPMQDAVQAQASISTQDAVQAQASIPTQAAAEEADTGAGIGAGTQSKPKLLLQKSVNKVAIVDAAANPLSEPSLGQRIQAAMPHIPGRFGLRRSSTTEDETNSKQDAQDAAQQHLERIIMQRVALKLHNKRFKAYNVLITPQEAVNLIQVKYRTFLDLKRNEQVNMNRTLHLGYERKVLTMRVQRQRMIGGFVQHLLYMLLLIALIFVQGGNQIKSRYDVVQAIEGYLLDLKTSAHAPHHMDIESISSTDDFWDWTEVRRRGSARAARVTRRAVPSNLPPPPTEGMTQPRCVRV